MKSYATLAIALMLTACKTQFEYGKIYQIDHTKVEESIRANFKEQVKDATLKTVTCPSGIEAKAQGTFECKAVEESGMIATITVTMNNDTGNIGWKVTSVADAPAKP